MASWAKLVMKWPRLMASVMRMWGMVGLTRLVGLLMAWLCALRKLFARALIPTGRLKYLIKSGLNVMVVVRGLRNGTFVEKRCVLVRRPVVTEKLVTLVRNACMLAGVVRRCYRVAVLSFSRYRRAMLSFITAMLVLERNI